jgi:hypothetical protein
MSMRPSIVGLGVLLSCVAPQSGLAESPAPPVAETQAAVKPVGFGISRITLTPKAATRLDIQVGAISQDANSRKIVAYSAIIYDLDGDAWVYRVIEPLTYMREPVVIERISKGYAVLSDGPRADTQVVTVGVPELYGAEVGVNGE